uniref:low affinity immunoglobulin epsilon Fc receptor-like n=1 Tax=Styela clava TaxID=7725 RepID=UPI00193A8BA8|nr:low affinity immunoglobulin epsilon Fc receptor-like [Styela clava]
MQFQNEMKHMRKKMDKMSQIDSSLVSNISGTQKEQLETFKKLTTQLNSSLAKISNETQETSSSIKNQLKNMKNEVSQLDSKIFIGDNKLKASMTEANSRMNRMFSISGWFRASNNLIYKRFTDSVNYATAKAQCEGMGARLVSTGIRNNLVKKEIFSKHYLTGANAWIGLDDINNEGIWVWSDGINNSPSAIWAPGEPTGGLNEDCAIMILQNSKLVVYDGGCTGSYRFVCEKDFA